LFKCILLEMLVIINFDYCYCPYLKRSWKWGHTKVIMSVILYGYDAWVCFKTNWSGRYLDLKGWCTRSEDLR
jgi:hypothetical protein